MIRLAVVVLAATLAAGAACAQSGDGALPNRPVRFIVPFPAGGSTDTVARLFGQLLGTQLGQQFVIENRVGASGNLGTEAVARAAPGRLYDRPCHHDNARPRTSLLQKPAVRSAEGFRAGVDARQLAFVMVVPPQPAGEGSERIHCAG